jgi:bifunctional non-homologous end joining protein LigD
VSSRKKAAVEDPAIEPPAAKKVRPVTSESRSLVISSPDKVLFPDAGVTKGEMAAYYEMIAPIMVPHMRARPVTMERFNKGIGEEGFFQKDVKKGFPEWLERVAVQHSKGTVHYPIVTDTRSLLWMANQNSITQHVWVTRAPDLFHPDILVFDLDPSVGDAAMLRSAAFMLRDLLTELGLPSWLKTTGSKGFHIAAPLDGKANSGDVSRFAHRVGRLLVQRDPDLFTQEFHKVDRGNRVLIDTGRNEHGATYAAAYAVRPKPGAPISAPCTWEELASGEVGPATFELRGMAERVAAVGDLWAEMLARPVALDDAARRVQELSGSR